MTSYESLLSMTVAFTLGIPGFESCRRFVLLQAPEFEPALCLKGLDGSMPMFMVVDPRRIAPEYDPVLSGPELERLGAVDASMCAWLAIIGFGEGPPVVNLRAPIVINPETMRGIQAVPADSPWAVDAPWPSGAACSS